MWLPAPCEWELPLSLLFDFLLSDDDELEESDLESESEDFLLSDDLPFEDEPFDLDPEP